MHAGTVARTSAGVLLRGGACVDAQLVLSKVIHWDVVNENLHFSFFEDKLGKDAAGEIFKEVAKLDSKPILFMNEFNTIEQPCDLAPLPTKYLAQGDVVNKLLDEWRKVPEKPKTDSKGVFEAELFHGEYQVTVKHESLKEPIVQTVDLDSKSEAAIKT